MCADITAMWHIPGPGRIFAQHYGVSHHNKQGFSSCHGHVESLDKREVHQNDILCVQYGKNQI